MFLKLDDLKPGEYLREAATAPVEVRKYEVEIIERLKADGSLPPNCFGVAVDVRVIFHVKGTALQMKESAEVWSKTYVVPTAAQVKEVALKAMEVPLTQAANDLLKDVPKVEGRQALGEGP